MMPATNRSKSFIVDRNLVPQIYRKNQLWEPGYILGAGFPPANGTLQIIVVTSTEILEQAHKLIDVVSKFDWAEPYEFSLYDFDGFEKTNTYAKLRKKDNWLFDYDRSRRGINRNHWSFCLEEIRFILIDPFAREIGVNGFVHEIAHASTCEDEIAKLVRKQLNHQLIKELRRRLQAKADRGQLLTDAVHVITFPMEIIANRWVAEKSRTLLLESLEEACSVWSEAGKTAGDLSYSLGPVLLCLRQYLSMRLKLDLAQEYHIRDKTSILSTIIRDFDKTELVRLVPERTDLWNLASKLRIAQYADKCVRVVRRLSKTVPLKSAKTAFMPPIPRGKALTARQAERMITGRDKAPWYRENWRNGLTLLTHLGRRPAYAGVLR